MSKKTVSLGNGIRLELITKGNTFCGIGKVWAERTLLRSGRPMLPEIRTPDGWLMTNYTVASIDASPAGITVDCTMQAVSTGIMEYMLHTVRNRYNTRDWAAGPVDLPNTHLELRIENIGDWSFKDSQKGISFSYQYVYRSDTHPIFKILDRGTWEPGGKATGNEFIMRNCFVPSRVQFESPEQHHSTEWFLPSCDNPNIFQFLPLQTELQGFSFTASDKGVLATWADEVSHVRSLFEKKRGTDEIEHWHEHAGDLAGEFRSAPMHVLWLPGKRDEIARFNTYEMIKEMVHDKLHGQLGMRRERVTTYGQIEEWTEPDMDAYREHGLPALQAAGMRKIGLASHFQNNMNVWGVSNMCCTVDYKVAESVGEDKLRAFCQAAKAAGIKVEMWGNTSISTLTWMFNQPSGRSKRIDFLPKEGSIMDALKNAKEPFVHNPTHMIEADHYTPVFAVLNLREPVVREYWLKHWGAAHDSIGLEGIFLDSSFNLSSDKFHFVQNTMEGSLGGATADQTALLGNYRPAIQPKAKILSQYRAHLDLMTEMQKLGYDYCTEDLGVFGIHRHGPGIEKRLDSLPIWSECICGFDVPALRKAGVEPNDIFFRALAYRMMWSVYWDIKNRKLSFNYYGARGDFDSPSDWHLSVLKAFNEVNDLTRDRRILGGEKGVVYSSGDKQVLWAFTDLTFPIGDAKPVKDVLAGTGVPQGTTTTAKLKALKHHIYVIG